MPSPKLPFPPMEAELVDHLPTEGDWQYEPKWDGFRGILENVEGKLHLWSRNARPLLRYFPELEALSERLPAGSAVDGEIVVQRGGSLDFDALQQRLHPADQAADVPGPGHQELAGGLPPAAACVLRPRTAQALATRWMRPSGSIGRSARSRSRRRVLAGSSRVAT